MPIIHITEAIKLIIWVGFALASGAGASDWDITGLIVEFNIGIPLLITGAGLWVKLCGRV